MNDRKNDIGSDEQELLEEFGTSLEALRTRHADCPKPEILLASKTGVLDEDTSRNIATHLRKCNFCQILLRDLTDGELDDARPEEQRRVHERVLKAAKSAWKAEAPGRRLLVIWFKRAVPVAALAAVVMVVIWVRLYRPRAPASTPANVAVQPAQPPASSVLQWEKLPIKLQASSVLILRGKPRTAQEKYAAELTAGLAYYRDDNFAEAVEQLSKVTKGFPRGVEGQLYLGISELKLEHNADAIVPLQAAKQLGPQQFRDDASWYLALALWRGGAMRAAATELQRLCRGKNDYSSRACPAEKGLVTP
jgi:hypothetical protein